MDTSDASSCSSEPLTVDDSLKDEPLVHVVYRDERRPHKGPAKGAHRYPERRDADPFERRHVPEADDAFAELDWIHPRGPWRA